MRKRSNTKGEALVVLGARAAGGSVLLQAWARWCWSRRGNERWQIYGVPR